MESAILYSNGGIGTIRYDTTEHVLLDLLRRDVLGEVPDNQTTKNLEGRRATGCLSYNLFKAATLITLIPNFVQCQATESIFKGTPAVIPERAMSLVDFKSRMYKRLQNVNQIILGFHRVGLSRVRMRTQMNAVLERDDSASIVKSDKNLP